MHPHKPFQFDFLIPILFGLFSFFLVVGINPLIPTNIAWLSGQDPSTHYLGWAFFRHSSWTWPLGLNPEYGLNISSSIAYSDSLPLTAFIFKPLESFLPDPFQYIGLWILFCFILQAWFSWKLAGLISQDRWQRILICGLIGLFAPPFLKRLGLHASLMGQFLILAALFLNLQKYRLSSNLAWLTLLCTATLVNIYLLVMVFALWLAYLVKLFQHDSGHYRSNLIQILFNLICIGFCLWQAGYLLEQGASIKAEGFGQYKLNLLSIFDAGRYSYLLKPIPHPEDLEEGFNFLGLGIIFLIPFAIFAMLRTQTTGLKDVFTREIDFNLPLVMIALCMTIFALSNQVSIGNWTFTYPLPEPLISIAGSLRSSGRFFWPAFYLLTFCICLIIARLYTKHIAITLLAVALMAQVIDTSAGWLPLKKTFSDLTQESPHAKLDGQFWRLLGKNHNQVVVWPIRSSQSQERWQEIAYFASQYQLGTNAVYLGRAANADKVKQFNTLTEDEFLSGKLDPTKIYLLLGDKKRWLTNKAPKLEGTGCIIERAKEDLTVVIAKNMNCNQLSTLN